ncbi:MAG: hypothetical protein U0791_00755 [Gemmataceae bacterium]
MAAATQCGIAEQGKRRRLERIEEFADALELGHADELHVLLVLRSGGCGEQFPRAAQRIEQLAEQRADDHHDQRRRHRRLLERLHPVPRDQDGEARSR